MLKIRIDENVLQSAEISLLIIGRMVLKGLEHLLLKKNYQLRNNLS